MHNADLNGLSGGCRGIAVLEFTHRESKSSGPRKVKVIHQNHLTGFEWLLRLERWGALAAAPVITATPIAEMTLSIHKSAVISPLNTTCRLPKDISNLLMEIWWAASLKENKRQHRSDRPGNVSSWNTESLWGEDASADIALCMKRLLLFSHNTCHFHRRQLWCLRLNCGNFADDPIQRVESFDSLASSSLFTHGNWKISAWPSKRPQRLVDDRGESQGERVEGKTL